MGLQQVGIIGGDTTGFEDSEEYFTNIAKNIPGEVGDYGVHLYVSNIAVDRGEIYDQVKLLYKDIQKIDYRLGDTIQGDVWEAGLRDGKTVLDCQTLINTASYATRMTDFTIQCLAGGINGVCYWDFDDMEHQLKTFHGKNVQKDLRGLFGVIVVIPLSKETQMNL